MKTASGIGLHPVSDTALCVTLPSSKVDDSSIHLRGVARCIERLELDYIKDVVLGSHTLTLHYDPIQLGLKHPERYPYHMCLDTLVPVLAAYDLRGAPPSAEYREIKIPVCYHQAVAPDLYPVAEQLRLTVSELIDLHQSNHYVCAMLGFIPGFSYLDGLPQALQISRKQTPNVRVNPGSIAIAGRQTGIYSLSSPGGWNIIGATPLALFSTHSMPPSKIHAGDRVTFESISYQEFQRLSQV